VLLTAPRTKPGIFAPWLRPERYRGSAAGADAAHAVRSRASPSPIHAHPGADEIYHALEGERLFHDGRQEARLGPGATVIFPTGEVHRVQSLTRMVLYRVQAGTDRHPEPPDAWPAP